MTTFLVSNKKIFISHSSKDKEVIDLFVDKILRLGLNINTDMIAYTSREDTGVINGENITEYIKKNIAHCDIAFLIISEHYKQSEICLNEMGAAWATDRCVKIILLPNLSFNSIGWLYNLNKGSYINNEEALDALYDDIVEKFNIQVKAASWNRYKKEFIESLNSIFYEKIHLPCSIEQAEICEEEFGLLDYREKFDEQNIFLISSLRILTNATITITESLNKRTAQLIQYHNQRNNISQYKAIMKAIANDYNKMSDTIDLQVPNIRSAFSSMVDYSVKIHHTGSVNWTTAEENRESFSELVTAMIKCKHTTLEQRRTLASATPLESTQIKAQKRLISCYDKLIETMDFCLSKANELTVL